MDLRRRTRLALASLMAAAAPTMGAVAEAHPPYGRGGRPLTVMTQNLYLGAGLEGAIAASSPEEFVAVAAQIYGTAVATNFPRRAESIADTIADEQPDLIGLQEVSRLTAERTAAGPALPSYDFLALLRAELAERGLAYRVAAVSENADIGPVPLLAPASGCAIVGPTPDCVVRLQDRDVVLVDDDTPRLRVQTARTGRYTAQQVLRLPDGTTASFARGWAFVDGRFEGRKFRFVNTHLEVASSAVVQEAQAREFRAGPARTRRTVVAVGDFNSAADPAVASTTTTRS